MVYNVTVTDKSRRGSSLEIFNLLSRPARIVMNVTFTYKRREHEKYGCNFEKKKLEYVIFTAIDVYTISVQVKVIQLLFTF